MIRALLVAALLVAGVAPAWAQSDDRWIAVFHQDGYRGKGQFRSMGGGDRTVAWAAQTHRIARTIFERTGTPTRVFSLPDTNQWSALLGGPRLNGEADSTRFRRAGCMGWVMTHDLYSSSFDGSGYSGEATAYFTGTGSTKGTFACSPLSGLWGIPGVVFTAGSGTQSNGGQGFFNGITNHYAPLTPYAFLRTRQFFANGDSVSAFVDRLAFVASGEAANVTPILTSQDYTGNNDSTIVTAWAYKTNCLYYNVNTTPYDKPAMILLAVADVLNRAGYNVKRKLALHIDLDHPYPDATYNTAPSESLFAYMDWTGWRHGGPVESHSSEIADDTEPLKTMWKSRASKWPSHPHSHNYLNLGDGGYFNLSDFSADSTKKAQRWTWMTKTIADTLGHPIQKGYERTATFPNNDVMFDDLFIPASAGYRDIRVRQDADSTGASKAQSLRRWRRVPGPNQGFVATSGNVAGLPYMYIEPKTNLPLYVHDSYEHPTSGDSLYVSSTDYLSEMGGYASKSLSSFAKSAIFDGATYWHPDLNVTTGRFMADFYRRLVYVYGRTKNIMEVNPIYRPKQPRIGTGTSRTTYTDNR